MEDNGNCLYQRENRILNEFLQHSFWTSPSEDENLPSTILTDQTQFFPLYVYSANKQQIHKIEKG